MDICDKRLLKSEKRGTISTSRFEPFPRDCCEVLSSAGWVLGSGELGEGGVGLERLVEEVEGQRRGEAQGVRGGRNREESRIYTALRWAPSAVGHALETLGVNVKGNSNYVKQLLITELWKKKQKTKKQNLESSNTTLLEAATFSSLFLCFVCFFSLRLFGSSVATSV